MQRYSISKTLYDLIEPDIKATYKKVKKIFPITILKAGPSALCHELGEDLCSLVLRYCKRTEGKERIIIKEGVFEEEFLDSLKKQVFDDFKFPEEVNRKSTTTSQRLVACSPLGLRSIFSDPHFPLDVFVHGQPPVKTLVENDILQRIGERVYGLDCKKHPGLCQLQA